jgi:FkbM family methyltransferase
MLKKIIAQLKSNKTIRFISWPVLTIRNKYKNKKNQFYEELLTNVQQGSLIVEIKDLPGAYEIDIRSRILRRILIDKDYEPEIVSILKKYLKTDKDAVNVGANIGIFTVLLADLINKDRKVLAVEPTPLAFGYLVNNLKRNNLTNKVVLYNGVCCDTPGGYNLNTIEGKEEFSSLGESYMNNIHGNVVQIKVQGETLDHLVNTFDLDPGIVLIDVEGAEMKVLKGASEMIAKYRPIIISELVDEFLIKQGNSSEEVVSFLKKLGYSVKSTNDHKEIKYPFSGNIIAIPNF